jgi:hypothetical protein
MDRYMSEELNLNEEYEIDPDDQPAQALYERLIETLLKTLDEARTLGDALVAGHFPEEITDALLAATQLAASKAPAPAPLFDRIAESDEF